MRPHQRNLFWLILCLFSPSAARSDARPLSIPHFKVTIKKGLISEPKDGRLFVILTTTNDPDPRLWLGHTGPDAPIALARDVIRFAPGITATLDERAFSFPTTNLSEMSALTESGASSSYFIQAVFAFNSDLRSPNAPGNLFSHPLKINFQSARRRTVKLELTEQIPPDPPPADSDQIKFLKIESKLLSQFHKRPMFLRAGIVLPRDYDRESSRRYPLWVRIGGLNARYTSVTNLMASDSELRHIWLADDTPRFILLQLDGTGPFGDCYQINSANSGPCGDALIQELIPYVEKNFRAIAQPRARVLSGTSTGGWVALALQIFYPDFFNGAWSSCPDPVDFRALQLVNVYEDTNAFVNEYGNERPSARDSKGDVTLTMRREVAVENLLGRGNSYTLSGEQWGAWNAAFGPRGGDGLPVPLWDPQAGKINHAVAEHWKKYDLRLILAQNWNTLGPKLQGKLHIASGEADQYFLNNAVHLLDEFLHRANPQFQGKIMFGPGQAHGWYYLTPREVLLEMKAATEQPQR